MKTTSYQHCVICHNECVSGKVLSNGKQFHYSCYQNILNNNKNLSSELFQLNRKVESDNQKINESQSFTNKLKAMFGVEQVDSSSIHDDIRAAKNEIKEINEKISQNHRQITALYDYWFETPPDWEKRKELIRVSANNCCQMCGKRNAEKHTHHKAPVSKGGSHLLHNLELLCVDCHSQTHGGRNVSTEQKTTSNVNRPVFSDRLELIQYAIKNGAKISFNYRKYEGEKSSRSITPERLEQKGKSLCVFGFCDLRQEERIFAIKRMSGVKLDD